MLALILFAITTPLLGIIFAHNQELKKWLLPFGVGLLLSTIFTHLLPEVMCDANANGMHAGWAVVSGFVLYFVLSSCLMMCPHDEHGCTNSTHKGVSNLLVIGFVVHAILDGVSIYSLSNNGVRDALVGLSIHRAIDGVALIALAHAHKLPIKTLYGWFAIVIASTLVGFGIGMVNLPIPEEYLTAFVCGTLIYMLTADMIPETHKNNRLTVNLMSMLMGMIVAYTMTNFTIHSH